MRAKILSAASAAFLLMLAVPALRADVVLDIIRVLMDVSRIEVRS